MKLISFTTIVLLLFGCASFDGDYSYEKSERIFYAQNDNPRQSGVLYSPLDQKHFKNPKLVIVVHGGGWSGRDLSDMESIAQSLVSHGFFVFNINYRLSPEHHHPKAVEDVFKATSFIQKYLKEKKSIKTNSLSYWGYSSGGHLVSYLALTKTKDSSLEIDAVVSGGTPFDLTRYPDSPYITKYLGKKRDEIPDQYIEASPSSHVHKKAPPFFLYHAREDDLVEYTQTTSFEFQLERNEIRFKRYIVPFWGHMGAFIFSSEAIKRAIQFLTEETSS